MIKNRELRRSGDPHAWWPIVAIVLMVGGLIAFCRAKHATKAEAAVQPIGWELADTLLTRRDAYKLVIGTGDFPAWRPFRRSYFVELKQRRDAVIRWASSQTTQPTIVFLGNVHRALGSSSIEAHVRRSQAETFERLQTEARNAQVIAFEQSGTDEVVTPAVWFEITKRFMRERNVFLPDQTIRQIMAEDNQAASRAIATLSSPPVICGEEWPIYLGIHLQEVYESIPRNGQRAANQLFRFLISLRSEIALIRTLEFLQRTHGTRGIIIQGALHGRDLERVANTYHITLRVLQPTVPHATE
ncbi:MAG: hypothetical protein WCV84_03055 [Patescibacteria group bacterium]